MKKERIHEALIEQLRKVPILQVACEKLNVSRNTVYTWRKQDKEFRIAMDKAFAEGDALVNDMAESQMISLMRKGSYPANAFWLRARHPKFKKDNSVHIKVAPTKKYILPITTTEAFDKVRLSKLPKQLRKKVIRKEMKLSDAMGEVFDKIHEEMGMEMPKDLRKISLPLGSVLKTILEEDQDPHEDENGIERF
ncbi:MAG: hypothetical protein V4665_03250 [Patescibacteria group bacterium]